VGVAGLGDHVLRAAGDGALDIGEAAVAVSGGTPHGSPACKTNEISVDRPRLYDFMTGEGPG